MIENEIDSDTDAEPEVDLVNAQLQWEVGVLIELLSDLLPWPDVDAASELVVDGEYRLAVELLGLQVQERAIRPIARVTELFRVLCKKMQLDEPVWRAAR
ncbi:hypothetical protein DFR29_104374 [Tahibacter aquaticus]|uniref:Uncharacterized protein n=1 Tax=Tahibacter aquaticus TaxID=520092 RepID=A0A4R6Z2U4_9GAMM|nr:hypothetical protein [Tahibacter aquaticus]TDR45937.1 hypothetical protein DFR29_104374 [Tahibacter aquaticus]